MTALKDLFLLDPTVVFLNHGSFGACPKVVFAAYQAWQRRFEDQPVKFMRELDGFEVEARRALAAYLHADPADLAFVTNVTYGVNLVARALDFEPGDEILTSDHEYGACDNAWNFVCRKTGAVYRHQPVRFPAASPAEVIEQLWQGVTPRTRLIYLSHITSPTALRMPVEEICRRARQQGIMTFIDGAHAPGQIPLDLDALDADFYTGNNHKWMMAPKGSGFLHANKRVHAKVEPLVVSRLFDPEQLAESGAPVMDLLTYNGTRDPSAFLATPEAIRFMAEHNWDAVRADCHALLRQAIQRVCDFTGLPPFYPLDSDFYSQMGLAPLPPETDVVKLRQRLYDGFKVELPVIQWQSIRGLRISIQGYNTEADVDALLAALRASLPCV